MIMSLMFNNFTSPHLHVCTMLISLAQTPWIQSSVIMPFIPISSITKIYRDCFHKTSKLEHTNWLFRAKQQSALKICIQDNIIWILYTYNDDCFLRSHELEEEWEGKWMVWRLKLKE